MQGDLISRKELIKELQENIKIGFYGEFTDGSDVAFTIKELERVINEQPTAYSVEDVVEELEEQKIRYKEMRKNTYCRRTEMDDCDSCRADHYLDARLEGVSKAIAIVRNGGKE